MFHARTDDQQVIQKYVKFLQISGCRLQFRCSDNWRVMGVGFDGFHVRSVSDENRSERDYHRITILILMRKVTWHPHHLGDWFALSGVLLNCVHKATLLRVVVARSELNNKSRALLLVPPGCARRHADDKQHSLSTVRNEAYLFPARRCFLNVCAPCGKANTSLSTFFPDFHFPPFFSRTFSSSNLLWQGLVALPSPCRRRTRGSLSNRGVVAAQVAWDWHTACSSSPASMPDHASLHTQRFRRKCPPLPFRTPALPSLAVRCSWEQRKFLAFGCSSGWVDWVSRDFGGR